MNGTLKLTSGAAWLASTLLVAGLAGPASADIITFTTPAGAKSGGQPVSAQATFTPGDNLLTIVLTNLQLDPKSVGQNLSGLGFTVGFGLTGGSLTSSLATARDIGANGTFTDSGQASTGWAMSTSGRQDWLNVLGTDAGPAYTLIGPPDFQTGLYDNANASIAGNGPHNPFLAGDATFVLSIPGMTPQADISGVNFAFGTTPGATVAALISPVPEPATISLLGLGGLTLLVRRRGRGR